MAWHCVNPHLFGSVGFEKRLLIWDTRSSSSTAPAQVVEAHEMEVNCLAFNPKNEYLVATGSADKSVVLRDLRKLATPLHTLSNHTEEVFQIGWSPKNDSILASCGADRRVMVWDLSR